MEIVIVRFKFWSMLGIENIFEYQWVDTEVFPDLCHHVNSWQTLDHDPGDGITLLVFHYLIK